MLAHAAGFITRETPGQFQYLGPGLVAEFADELLELVHVADSAHANDSLSVDALAEDFGIAAPKLPVQASRALA